MKRLSREKRNQLITVILVTLAILALIGFGLIRPQYDSLSKIAKARKAADNKLQSIKHAITNSEAIANEWNETNSCAGTCRRGYGFRRSLFLDL